MGWKALVEFRPFIFATNRERNKQFRGETMDLCGEFVTHKVFGRGRIIGLENSRVTVRFLELNENKKFIYPSAFGRFLNLENEQLVKQIQSYKMRLPKVLQMRKKRAKLKKLLKNSKNEKRQKTDA